MADRQFAVSGDWALATDGLQWILQRRHARRRAATWDPVSFVRSTKSILVRCMREKGVPAEDARALFDPLPDCFDDWAQNDLEARYAGISVPAAMGEPG